MKARIDTLLEEVFFCIIEPSIEKREKSMKKIGSVYTSPGRWGAHYTTVHYPPQENKLAVYMYSTVYTSRLDTLLPYVYDLPTTYLPT